MVERRVNRCQAFRSSLVEDVVPALPQEEGVILEGQYVFRHQGDRAGASHFRRSLVLCNIDLPPFHTEEPAEDVFPSDGPLRFQGAQDSVFVSFGAS